MVNNEHPNKPTGKNRGFLILRVSDRKQANKYGPDVQRAEAYQGAKECPIPLEISPDREAFWVETASGWNRKQFNAEMAKRLEEYRRGLWEVLVFARVDRESRFLAGSFEVLNQLLKAGMPIYFAKHRLLLRHGDTEAFDIYFDLVREARSYIKILKANCQGGRLQAMEAGKIPSGFGSRGLTGYDWKNKRFVKNAINPAVDFMLHQYLEGYSMTVVLFQARERGFVTKFGKQFAFSSVSKMLHHARWYAGIITFCGREFRGLIDPLITLEEADRILDRLSRNVSFQTAYGRAHWWTGRVRCGTCNGSYSLSKSHGCRCSGNDYRLLNRCYAPCLGFESFQRSVGDALRLTLSHPQALFEQICAQIETREKEMAFLTTELKEKQGMLAIIKNRLDRLSHQHEMEIINDAQLLERSAGVIRDAKDVQSRVQEIEAILRTPAGCGMDTATGLVKDFQDAFHLSAGAWQARFLSTATSITADWVNDLGMLCTIPCDDVWERLAEKLNLRMLVYPPDQEEIDGKKVKATVRITGEFAPCTENRVNDKGIEVATVSTLSLLHGPRRRRAAYEG